ncbi:carboxylesterase/lipase family protein [Streptomyces caniscabiei]|uniref:hypothetical protein n=1 Tax=Streptomyces caniscabiei TaxID=2746961 RepID=UPI0029AE0193|nr:hypothetical protein [Streptomyces caniscabiei]MDX3726000.1 hypothetical protein [Streptomyces caniscabiei]
MAERDIPRLHDVPATRLLEIQQSEASNGAPPWGDPGPRPGFGAFVDGTVIPRHPFADGAAPFSADKPLICGTCRDETVFFSLFGPPDIFTIDEAGLRSRLSTTYQGAELDRTIRIFHATRPHATPTQPYFAITTSSRLRTSTSNSPTPTRTSTPSSAWTNHRKGWRPHGT